MAYAALQRTTVDLVAIQLANRRSSILVRIHLHECKSTISLEASLENVTEVLEQRNQIVLSGIRSKITNVAGSLPLGSLLSDHVVALDAVGREVVVAEWSCGGHAHSNQGLLLGDGRLALLVGPIAANSARAKPFTIHRVEGLVCLGAITESNKAISTGAASLHVPHNTCF